MNLSNFTIKAAEAVQQAQQLAFNAGNPNIESEHILRALLEQQDSPVSYLLKKNNVALHFIDQKLNEAIERLRDMKARLSTKMIGETLEQHCEIEFNRLRATAFSRAYFEKDNDASTGSKGDFIFRDADEAGTRDDGGRGSAAAPHPGLARCGQEA